MTILSAIVVIFSLLLCIPLLLVFYVVTLFMKYILSGILLGLWTGMTIAQKINKSGSFGKFIGSLKDELEKALATI